MLQNSIIAVCLLLLLAQGVFIALHVKRHPELRTLGILLWVTFSALMLTPIWGTRLPLSLRLGAFLPFFLAQSMYIWAFLKIRGNSGGRNR
jgi:hypothetical protein